MKSKKWCYRTVFVGVSMYIAAVSASAITVTAGDFEMKLDIYDSGTGGYGATQGVICKTEGECDTAASTPALGARGGSSDTMGIFSVSSIYERATGIATYTRGTSVGFLTGVFGGLTDHKVSFQCSPSGYCTTTTESVGGTINIWENPSDWKPAVGATGLGVDLPSLLYPSITGVAGGSLFLSAAFAPGVLGGGTTTYTTTYDSNFGNGAGFLEVTGGSAQDLFDTNGIADQNGHKHDLSFTATFDFLKDPDPNLGWTVSSTGQVKGLIATEIPEPASLALVGLGLAGLAAGRRRQR